MVISILAVTDSKNEIAGGIIPIFVGMSIAVVGLAFGHNCGFSLNPARDFGPRYDSYFFMAFHEFLDCSLPVSTVLESFPPTIFTFGSQ